MNTLTLFLNFENQKLIIEYEQIHNAFDRTALTVAIFTQSYVNIELTH